MDHALRLLESPVAEQWSDLKRVAAVGDVNDDGLPDWAVGAPESNDGGSTKGTVYLSVELLGDPAWLRAEQVEAEFDAAYELQVARAAESVRFEGPATRAEADRAATRRPAKQAARCTGDHIGFTDG